MIRPTDFPLLVFVTSFILLLLSLSLGGYLYRKAHREKAEIRQDFATILAATLTLLGLIIGFTFSMAIDRYDLRKNLEAEETKAISIQYLSADMLAEPSREQVRQQLRAYTQQRILYYQTRDGHELTKINTRTAEIQASLWADIISQQASTKRSPLLWMAVSGMSDVLSSQALAHAASINRIPPSAWILMVTIATFCHLLVGYGARNEKSDQRVLLILPFVISMAFFLISDIDSTRAGVIRVQPENLINLSASLR